MPHRLQGSVRIDERQLQRLPREPRYQALDFWRGIACLLVVIYHATLVYNITRAPHSSAADTILRFFGWFHIGVPLFFVISGYCIAATADGTRLRGDSVLQYFKRRFRRIYPPLWAAIVLSAAFFVLVDIRPSPGLLSSEPWQQLRPWWFSGWQWIGNLTLTETWRHYIVGAQRVHFPGQAWTLCYEEQFYAVVGLLILVPHRFFTGVLFITVADVLLLTILSPLGIHIDGVFLDGYWLTFAAGVLVYYVLNYGESRSAWFAVAAALVGMIFGIFGAVPGGGSGFAFAAILIFLKPFDRALIASRWSAPFLICGRMCYSLYLVHQLLVKVVTSELIRLGVSSDWGVLLLNVPLCIAVSVAAGWAFHLSVERRFLNLRQPSPSPSKLPAGFAVALE